MISEAQKQELLAELPQWIEQDAAFRAMSARMLRGEFADKQQTESRFDRVLEELRRDREEQARKWDEAKAESDRRWAEQNEKWAEQNEKWAEQNRRWDEAKAESDRRWAEQNEKWAEQDRKWAEAQSQSDQRWEETRKEFQRVHAKIDKVADRIDRRLGAMGARWGMSSERAFRNALAGILEKTFGVQVLNVTEFDETGEVFGRPDQIELDVVIKNGSVLILELKSSMSRSDVYAFERKARFYEKRHGRRADRLIVISPMVDDRALKTAETLGIEVYGDAEDVAAI